MQRSRTALLQRKALDKTTSGRNLLYTLFSLSLLLLFAFALWGLFFLFENGRTFRKVGKFCSAINESRRYKNCSVPLLKDCFIIHNAISSSIVTFPHEQNVNDVNFDENVHFQSDSLMNFLPIGLEIFKSRAFKSNTKTRSREWLEPTASKGSKVLGFNKEAKGASNVLQRDTNKYLRNPCSAEDKFIILELSEETLVSRIEIANFEHHSSNLKDFEVLGSLVYPTNVWINLGFFTAENAKLAQSFVIDEPKWARYLKLRLLSHHGSEFYCTLTVFEVYGHDAVEEMLQDLVSVQDNTFITPPLSAHNEPDFVQVSVKHGLADRFREHRYHQAGGMPGDTVLKILMHKLRSSDSNLSILERFLEELNSKYGNILRQFSDGIRENHVLVERSQENMRNLLRSQESVGKGVGDLNSWRSLVSLQLDNLYRDNAMLRSEIEKVREKQNSIENQGTAVVFICMIFLLFGSTRLLVDIVASVYTGTLKEMKSKSGKFSWIFLLLTCSFFIFIIILLN